MKNQKISFEEAIQTLEIDISLLEEIKNMMSEE